MTNNTTKEALAYWRQEKKAGYITAAVEKDLTVKLGEGWSEAVTERADGAFAIFLAHLDGHVAETGHAKVPYAFRSADGYRLGSKVSRIRTRRAGLRDEQTAAIERRYGWVWDAQAEAFAVLLIHLDEHVAGTGHANVPFVFKSADGYRLGNKVNRIRTRRAELRDDQTEALESRPGWVWDALAEAFAVLLFRLDEYVAEVGHANVPRRFYSADGYQLGNQVSNRRKHRARLSDGQTAALESRPGWVWDAPLGRRVGSS